MASEDVSDVNPGAVAAAAPPDASVTAPPAADAGARRQPPTVMFDPRNVWRIALIAMGALALALFVRFVLEDAGSVIFTLLMAWALSITMEPAVGWLHRHGWKRGLATGFVMICVLVGIGIFAYLFGSLLVGQIVELLKGLPDLAAGIVKWINTNFGADLDIQKILDGVGISPGSIASWAASAAGGLFGVVFSIVGSVFGVFTLGLFTFYLSADAPRLRRWISHLLPATAQRVNTELWDTAIEKAGGYVAARLILALINGGTTAIVLYIIGMPYWLALGIWTGLVAQFVPTIGTYIAIALPVLVGLLSDDPMDGIIALVWALLYQQVENLTLEPKISARAVDLHPAVSFGSVMFGAALFGVAGALLAVPTAAIIMSFIETYAPQYDVVDPTPDKPKRRRSRRAEEMAHVDD